MIDYIMFVMWLACGLALILTSGEKVNKFAYICVWVSLLVRLAIHQ